jgi:hypothetical protein
MVASVLFGEGFDPQGETARRIVTRLPPDLDPLPTPQRRVLPELLDEFRGRLRAMIWRVAIGPPAQPPGRGRLSQ